MEIDLRPAGVLIRAGAFILDSLIKIGVWIAISMAIGVLGAVAGVFGGEELGSGIIMGLSALVLFVLEWIYHIYFEASSNGATPGKRAFKIKVSQLSGAPITFNQAVVRNMLRGADLLPGIGAVGLVSMLSTRRFQRLGDLVAETVVVYSGEIDLLYREDSALEKGERLRPMVDLSREEQVAIVMFAERAKDWTTPRQEELAEHAGGIVSAVNSKQKVKDLFSVARWIRSHH